MPATTSIPPRIATSTIVVPMSGCRNTSAIGIPAIAHTRRTSRRVGTGDFSSESTAASMMMSPTFTNSEGVIWKPPSENQRWAAVVSPSGVEPIPGIRTRISVTIIPP